MKVTEASTFRLMQTNLERITSKLQDLRNQGATGLKLNKPSDDPASIRPVLTTRTQIRDTDRYLETMGVTADKMEATDGYMASIENVLQRVKEITTNAINSGMSVADRATLADEVAQLKQQLLDSANATVDGKYIFAGYQENTKPFVENINYNPALAYDPTNTNTWPVLYNGNANPTQLEITPGEYVDANITGNQLFLGISNANWDETTHAANAPSAPGQVDIFSVLTRTEAAIRVNDITGPDGMQANLDNLESAANQERVLRSRLGNRATRVEAATAQEESVKIDLAQILSRYQDADAIATFNDISKQETAFQAALSITAKVSKISILDYL